MSTHRASIDAPPALAGYLRDAEAAIGTITARVPGAKSAVLHAIFNHAEPIKDSIGTSSRSLFPAEAVRDAPPGQSASYAHVDRVLQTSFFLVLAALGPVQPTNSEAHFASWWVELRGHAQLVDMAAEHAQDVDVAVALDVLRRARWEWTSFASRNDVARLLNAEFRSPDEREVIPRDLIGVVAAVVGATEIIVRECWPRT
ncbi:hypothetical protein CspeluHIS016_0308630 [Cutaneotrichosporon spelunceum]|uniref:Uncharacterized protein n=1 Tax=Cutaneotrichosporon spelunceum TaxID=1672016 RepID=A0AAD3YCE0_9TREE|nr:hypothetical protein CspeluHIS016_0308630 [Cutaneotrichosporon spelunceum]